MVVVVVDDVFVYFIGDQVDVGVVQDVGQCLYVFGSQYCIGWIVWGIDYQQVGLWGDCCMYVVLVYCEVLWVQWYVYGYCVGQCDGWFVVVVCWVQYDYFFIWVYYGVDGVEDCFGGVIGYGDFGICIDLCVVQFQ